MVVFKNKGSVMGEIRKGVKSSAITSPAELIKRLPIDDATQEFIKASRQAVINLFLGLDDRLLVIVGPCSIHDPMGAREYASRLKGIAKDLDKELLIVMRTYLQKPRTTTGWKGMVNDPTMDGKCDIADGMVKGREFLREIAQMGMPTAMEILDPPSVAYLGDLIAAASIGARTTESQIHRELVSGLPFLTGFKNNTEGNIRVAVDACEAANGAHRYLGLSQEGIAGVLETQGNPFCHVILRGSGRRSNFDPLSVDHSVEMMEKRGLHSRVMVDCSHGNSGKDHKRQPAVSACVAELIAEGRKDIFGIMLESHLVEGKQKASNQALTYGQSITDSCLGWEDTVLVLEELAQAVKDRREAKGARSTTAKSEAILSFRRQIDLLDTQLVKLLNHRAELALEIGNLKRYLGWDQGLRDEQREAEVLKQIVSMSEGPLTEEELGRIYKAIMGECLTAQKDLPKDLSDMA